MNGAILSSKKMDYCTPKEFFAELDKEFHFALDAAATEASAKCAAFYTPENDGLTKPWNIAGGAVFCNPPYGREIGKWVRKAYEEAQSGATIVLLIPARTDTSYFHDYILGHAESGGCEGGCGLRMKMGWFTHLRHSRPWWWSTTERKQNGMEVTTENEN